jgi:hypothetical protein
MPSILLIWPAKIRITKMHFKHNQKDTLNNFRTYLRIYREEQSSIQQILKSLNKIRLKLWMTSSKDIQPSLRQPLMNLKVFKIAIGLILNILKRTLTPTPLNWFRKIPSNYRILRHYTTIKLPIQIPKIVIMLMSLLTVTINLLLICKNQVVINLSSLSKRLSYLLLTLSSKIGLRLLLMNWVTITILLRFKPSTKLKLMR